MTTQGVLRQGLVNKTIIGSPYGRPSYTIPVSSSSGGGGGTNEPVGYTLVTSQGFTTIPSDGWYFDGASWGGNMTQFTDATAPESPSTVARFTYPTGFVDGSGPGAIEHGIIGGTKVYARIVFRHSANWYCNTTGTNKMCFIWLVNQPRFFFNAKGSGNGTIVGDLTFQNCPIQTDPVNGGTTDELHLTPNLSSGVLARGDWHTFECLLENGTAGAANDRVRGWIDGVATHDYTIQTTAVGEANTWDYVAVRPIWGGNTGQTVPATQTWDIDHYYVSNQA